MAVPGRVEETRGWRAERAPARREAPLGIINEQPEASQRVGARHILGDGQQVD